MRTIIATGVVLASCLAAGSAFAQIAVSSNDGKMALENGVAKTVANPPPDSVTVLDLGVSPVKVLGTISGVPGSVAGPPLSVAITPDESLALVAASSKIDPNDPAKTIADNRVTIVDLKSQKVLGQLQAGAGAAGPGQPLVKVDPVRWDAERGQGLALGGEVLRQGGAPGVADVRHRVHPN